MIRTFYGNLPYKIILHCKNEDRKFTYYSYDCIFLSYDDERYNVEIYNSKYDMPILQKQQRIFN